MRCLWMGGLAAVGLCAHVAVAGAEEGGYITDDDANLPFCLSPDRYNDGLDAATRDDPDMFKKTGCVVPIGGLPVEVLGRETAELYKMRITSPSGKKVIVYAPLDAVKRKPPTGRAKRLRVDANRPPHG